MAAQQLKDADVDKYPKLKAGFITTVSGRWPKELGTTYSELHMRRTASDYYIADCLSAEYANDSVERAERIIDAVRTACPALDVG